MTRNFIVSLLKGLTPIFALLLSVSNLSAQEGFYGYYRFPDVHELRYPFEDVEVWGATARILHHFIELLYPLIPACRNYALSGRVVSD